MSVPNLRAAFKRTGIFTFDPSSINQEVLAPATVYEPSNGCPSDQDSGTKSSEVCDSSKILSHDVENDHDKPSSFFLEQTKALSKKKSVPKRCNNTLSKLTSGKCLTDPETENDIKSHKKITVRDKRKSCFGHVPRHV